jgi:hypothetical protein
MLDPLSQSQAGGESTGNVAAATKLLAQPDGDVESASLRASFAGNTSFESENTSNP